MQIECIDRTGNRTTHTMSDELTPKEAMERLGVYKQSFTVTIWPEGRPDQARLVQKLNINSDGNTVETRV